MTQLNGVAEFQEEWQEEHGPSLEEIKEQFARRGGNSGTSNTGSLDPNTDADSDEETDDEDVSTTSSDDSQKQTGDIGDLPTQLEREIRLLIRKASGYVETEVYEDQTFVTIKYEHGYD